MINDEDFVAANYRRNQRALLVTTSLFFAFVVAEIVGAIASNSLSLLGDAAAMSVDVFTYLTNMYAERVKLKAHGHLSKDTRYMLEVYVPTFSVVSLLAVTGYVLNEALVVLMAHGVEDDVDIYALFGFSSANAIVDIISGYMFYKRGRAAFLHSSSAFTAVTDPQIIGDTKLGSTLLPVTNDVNSITAEDSGLSTLNLNMLSGSDTLRTLSVFIAALVVVLFKINGSVCDAWAAVIVSFTIFVMVVPLIVTIYRSYTKISSDAR